MVRWSMRAFRKRSPLREQMESHTIRASESRHTNRMPESEFSHSAALASAAIIHGKEFLTSNPGEFQLLVFHLWLHLGQV